MGGTDVSVLDGPVLDGPVLDVQELTVAYDTADGPVIAVDAANLRVEPAQFVGVVGESGCGKSTMLFALARLLNPPARIVGGRVLFRGQDLAAMSESELRSVRWRRLSVVMQSAMNALNPVASIAGQFRDVLRAHGIADDAEIARRSAEALSLVGIDVVHLRSYPHQLSGGMRQRAMIAMALLLEPDLVIMDEPTSALDVVAQRALMIQIKQLQQRLGFAVLFVTHDMSLVSHFSDVLVVMYAAQIVEVGPTRNVFDTPSHPYTRGLLDAFPSIRGPRLPLVGIPGRPPELSRPPSGCRFHPRCPAVMPHCPTTEPSLYEAGPALARCLLHEGRPAYEPVVGAQEVGT